MIKVENFYSKTDDNYDDDLIKIVEEVNEKLSNQNLSALSEIVNLKKIIEHKNNNSNDIFCQKIISEIGKDYTDSFNSIFKNITTLNIKQENLRFISNIGAPNVLKKINKVQGKIMIDLINKENIYFYEGFYLIKGANILKYSSLEKFIANSVEKTININCGISGTYPTIHNNYLYCLEFNEKPTNIISKVNLNTGEIEKSITIDAPFDNNHNSWGGYNDIQLFNDENQIYVIFAGKKNNLVNISTIDFNTFKITKTVEIPNWPIKKQCGPIFIANGIVYRLKNYCDKNNFIESSFDLLNNIYYDVKIKFDYISTYDSSLTYFQTEKKLFTVNNATACSYSVDFNNIIQ